MQRQRTSPCIWLEVDSNVSFFQPKLALFTTMYHSTKPVQGKTLKETFLGGKEHYCILLDFISSKGHEALASATSASVNPKNHT